MRPTFTIFVPNYRYCSIMQRMPAIALCLLLLAVLSCRKDDDHTLASRWAQESRNYLQNNRLDSAVLLNFKILENIDTTSSNNFAIIASTYNDLGDIFYKAAIFDRAMRMYARSLYYGNMLDNKTEESRARRGIWRCSHVLELPDKDTAIAHSLNLLPNIHSEKEIASLYNNITGYFMYNEMYDSAFIYNRIAIEKSPDSATLYRNYNIRSELFINAENYDSAWHYASMASVSHDIYTKATSFYRLSRIAEIRHNDSSVYYLKYYSELLDSIHNIKSADSINVVLYRKQLEAVKHTAQRNRTLTTVLALVVLLLVCGAITVLSVTIRKKNAMTREAEALKQKLSELNAYLVENNKKADKYEQYSEQYKELLARQEYMETTFVTQLVAARDKCIETFKRGSFYKKLPSLIEKGDTILRIDKRKELQETINKDFILLRHSLMTYFDVTDEEFFLYCLSASGFSTKECAACRGVSVSAIRMQRMRMNNKIKSFFSTDIDLSHILL